MNGQFGKQISVETTTRFYLGNSTPRGPFKDSFGWYHNPLMTSLRNQHEVASFHSSDLMMGITKDGKLVLRQIQTYYGSDALGIGGDVQLGFQGTHIIASLTTNRTTKKTFARDEAYENCTNLDVWRGFIYQDLSARSSAKYEFTCNLPNPLPLAILEDSNERLKYLGCGMCGKIAPAFVGVSTIQIGHLVNGPCNTQYVTNDDIVSSNSKMTVKVKTPQARHFRIHATKGPLPTGGVEPK